MTHENTQFNIQTDIEILDPFVVKREIIQYDHLNPFYVPLEGSQFRYSKTKFLADEFKNINILCLVNEIELSNAIKNKIRLFIKRKTILLNLNIRQNMLLWFVVLLHSSIYKVFVQDLLRLIKNC